jgi:hypothetical protein
MIKLIDLLKEAKQVGNLYHFTYDTAVLKILKNGLYFKPDNTELTKHKDKFYISTTRDHTGAKFYKGSEMTARVTLDGNKISEQYSIEPINVENIWNKVWGLNQKRSSKDFYSEERIFSSKGGYLDPKYIIKIDTIIPEDEVRKAIEWGKEDSKRSVNFDDSTFDYVDSGKLNFVQDFNSK